MRFATLALLHSCPVSWSAYSVLITEYRVLRWDDTMPAPIPERHDAVLDSLGEALDALLDFTGATAGWVGLAGADGRLTFPIQRGQFGEGWLALQQGRRGPWGF